MLEDLIPLIVSTVLGIIIAIFGFIINRLINELDKCKEEIEKIKEDNNKDKTQTAINSSKIEDIKQYMERIYDRINN